MIIFDFDQTLVDTSSLEDLRAGRKWNIVMGRLDELSPYDGINDLMKYLQSKTWPVAILTNSPDMVPRRFIEHYGWPVSIVLGSHQVGRQRKPDPHGLHLAMEEAGVGAESIYHVGDQVNDILASRAAGVISIGAAWGISDPMALRESSPDYLFDSVAGLRSFVESIS